MVGSLSPLFPSLSVILLLSSFLIPTNGGSWAQAISQTCPCPEKLVCLHFYFHDTVSSKKNATAVRIAGTGPQVGFGTLVAADDPLTQDPSIRSTLVGRAQGMYALVSQTLQEEFALLMVLSFAFVRDEYNGSSLSILGRNAVANNTREMPILGGSGVFRLARGYAIAKTYRFWKNGDAIVEYNVTVYTPTC